MLSISDKPVIEQYVIKQYTCLGCGNNMRRDGGLCVMLRIDLPFHGRT